MRNFSRLNPRTLMASATKRLWMASLQKWKIIYMPLRLGDIRPWSVATLALGSQPKQRGCKVAGQEEARESRQRGRKGASQEEARESHHIFPGM
jgi:hypothetical protein